jgi:hypothetical protein
MVMRIMCFAMAPAPIPASLNPQFASLLITCVKYILPTGNYTNCLQTGIVGEIAGFDIYLTILSGVGKAAVPRRDAFRLADDPPGASYTLPVLDDAPSHFFRLTSATVNTILV